MITDHENLGRFEHAAHCAPARLLLDRGVSFDVARAAAAALGLGPCEVYRCGWRAGEVVSTTLLGVIS